MENTNKGARKFYCYLVSFAALMMMVISGVTIVSTTLKMTVFPQADNWSTMYAGPGCDGMVYSGQPTSTPEQCAKQKEENKKQQEQNRKASQQSNLVWSISLLVIAIPLFVFHWRQARKD